MPKSDLAPEASVENGHGDIPGGRARLLIDALMHSLWVHGALDALNPQYSYGSVFAFLAPLARMNLSSSSGAQIAFPSSSRILYGAVTPGGM